MLMFLKDMIKISRKFIIAVPCLYFVVAVTNIWWLSSDSRNTNNEHRQSPSIKKIPQYYALMKETKALDNNISTIKTSSLEEQNSLCSTEIVMFYNLIKQSTLQMGMCEDKQFVGKPGHGGRYVCVDKIHRDKCIQYTIGYGLDITIEHDIVKTYGCVVHYFVCNVDISHAQFTMLSYNNIHVHTWCVSGLHGSESMYGEQYSIKGVMATLNHKHVDILRIKTSMDGTLVSPPLLEKHVGQIFIDIHFENKTAVMSQLLWKDYENRLKMYVSELRRFEYEIIALSNAFKSCQFGITLRKYQNKRKQYSNLNAYATRAGSLLHNMSASVCIPAIPSDMDVSLPRLLQSINMQTFLPLEVIIVISNTSQTECAIFNHRLQLMFYASVLRMFCVSKLQYQSVSRQNASTFAEGSMISFIDADDIMFPNRLEVILSLFLKHTAHMILHGFTNDMHHKTHINWTQVDIRDGNELYDIERSTIDKHAWLIAEIMHSQVSVLRNVCYFVKFRTEREFYRTEDASFVRDVISLFGRKTNTAIFINTPLSWHVPRELQGSWYYYVKCEGVSVVVILCIMIIVLYKIARFIVN